jgi:hypothetical protein
MKPIVVRGVRRALAARVWRVPVRAEFTIVRGTAGIATLITRHQTPTITLR